MIKSVRWVTRQAATGLKDLPRNGAWLLSKALAAPSSMSRTDCDDVTGGIGSMAVTHVDSLPGVQDAVEIRLKRAEVAVAKAKQAEQDALAEAEHVKELADAAKRVATEGKERVRQAERDAKQDADRRVQAAKEHFAQLLEKEREKAGQAAQQAVERVEADVRAASEKARCGLSWTSTAATRPVSSISVSRTTTPSTFSLRSSAGYCGSMRSRSLGLTTSPAGAPSPASARRGTRTIDRVPAAASPSWGW